MIKCLSTRLKEVRIAKRLSQKDVATSLGISASVISNYEAGTRTPSVEQLIALADFYRCSTDYLLGLETTTKNTIDVSMLTDEQLNLLKQLLQSFK